MTTNAPPADCLGEHSDLRIESGALIFPMPVAVYDQLMDSDCLPRGACYNGPRGVLEVDAVPNGRYHDPRADAMFILLWELTSVSGVTARVGTAPVEDIEGDRRHPDAQLLVSPAKLGMLRTASRPAPVPDLVVEVDTTPLSLSRDRARRAAYARLGVPELWLWTRTGGTEARPDGVATLQMLAGSGYRETTASDTVPGLGPRDLEILLREPDDLARDQQAKALAARLAPAFARRWSVGSGRPER